MSNFIENIDYGENVGTKDFPDNGRNNEQDKIE